MLTFVPHKINENYNKVEFYRVNKELCNNEVYKNLSPTAILLYSLLCDRLSLSYTNEQDKKYEINLEELGHRILKNVPKQNQKYVKSQLDLLDKNFFDYITYWYEKYYRNGFCDGVITNSQ